MSAEVIHHPVVPEYICEYRHPVRGPEGGAWSVRFYGVPQGRGVWDGWLIFFSDRDGSMRRTDREVEQRSRQDLAQWAARLTPDYLQRAMARSHPFTESLRSSPDPRV